MRMIWFAKRCGKEIRRDKLNLFFGVGFPVILLLLLSFINRNVPAEAGLTIFAPEALTPAVSTFGLTFLSLFSALLIAKDRESALMTRLLTSPLTAGEFVLGYVLPLLPIALAQSAICYLLALALGLAPTVSIVWAILLNLPVALFFIGVGLLCGTVMNTKQVGGLCGALLTNLSGWLSGAWFDLALVGGAFETVAELLPFVHAVRVGREALAGNLGAVLPDLLIVSGYAVFTLGAAIIVFVRKMKKGRIV